MKRCLKVCKELETTCPIVECRYHIEYPEDLNCVLETVSKNGKMTLREASERLGISFVRVKQIEDKALKKISRFFDKESI